MSASRMLEAFILGAIQGIAEWLPVSSEGLIVLAKAHVFSSEALALNEAIAFALFLHLGTAFAAIVYFRNDVVALLQALLRYRQAPAELQALLRCLIVATLLSGALGVALLGSLGYALAGVLRDPRLVTAAVGMLLLVTGALQLRVRASGHRTVAMLTHADALWLGVTQGLAVLPGLSRSGLTVATLLLRRFDAATTLRVSFLLSIPIVIGGNIVAALHESPFGASGMTPLTAAVALTTAFTLGLATIHALLRVAERVNFGKFVMLFGVLTIIAAIVG